MTFASKIGYSDGRMSRYRNPYKISEREYEEYETGYNKGENSIKKVSEIFEMEEKSFG